MRNIYLVITCFLFYSCSNYSPDIEAVLKQAGSNRGELEKALNHYKQHPQDSLKYQATCFLIKNMPYHYSMEEYYLSPTGEKYRPDLSIFNNIEDVKNHCDSLINNGYKVVQNELNDLKTVDSSFLVNNIELAFQVWQKPWAREVPFIDFCRYILPYKAQTEQLSLLRKEMMKRFIPVLDSSNVTNPLDACILINERLKRVMRYERRGIPFYPTIEETLKSGISECEGLCNLGAFVMRAVGIPVAVDQTIWTKMDLGHNWCAVLSDGKFYSFDPGENSPAEHVQIITQKRYRIPAKVYRSRFDPFFPDKKSKDDGYDTFLKDPMLYDVTKDYPNKTLDFNIAVDKNITGLSDLVYLCVYNYYRWQPIAIGVRNDSICSFKNVVGDNIFMVASSPNGKNLQFVTAPFYVDENGTINKFFPQTETEKILTIKKKPKKIGLIHILYYWNTDNNRFTSLNYIENTDTTQTYNQVPKNALLWFAIPKRVYNQRIFFIRNDSILYY